MITPVKRQILSDATVIKYAKPGDPQTQFEAPQSESVEAGNESLAAYASAQEHGFAEIPPAQCWIYADGEDPGTGAWHPSGQLVP